MIGEPSSGVDAKQAARLRRFLVALPVYAVMGLLLYLAHAAGLIRGAPVAAGIGAMVAVNAVLYLSFRSGLNLRFRDPSLTWLQIFLASTILLYLVYHFDRERNFALMMCLVIFVFGAFRFNVRQFLGAAMQFLAGFGLVIYLLLRFRPEYADPHLLGLQWIALATVLPCFALVGGMLSELRRKLRYSNEELSSALATVQIADKESRESETRFRNTFDFASIGMAIVALDGKWLQANKALCELLGYTESQLKELSFQDVTHPEDLESDLGQVSRALRGEIGNYQMEKRYVHKDGHYVRALLNVSVMRDGEGAPVQFIAQIQDITSREQAQQALRESEERFRSTFDHASVGIMHTSLDRRILVLNHKFCEMVGYSAEELQQGSVRKIHHPEDSDADQHLEKQLLAGQIENFSFEKRYIRKNGTVFWGNRTVSLVRDATGQPKYFIRVIEDISARKDAEEKLLHLAHFDTLTDLPNRAMFHDRLTQALLQARRRNELVGIVFLDLDRFKLVNDTLGHAMGDLLLQKMARRLSVTVRPGDTVGRLGGDEFAIILGDLRSPADASLVAQKILKALASPFRLDSHERHVTTSIGISLYPDHGDDNDVLLKAADSAMYAAKEKGRNTFEFFSGQAGIGDVRREDRPAESSDDAH